MAATEAPLHQPALKDDRRVVTFVAGVDALGSGPVTALDIERAMGLAHDRIVAMLARLVTQGYIKYDRTGDKFAGVAYAPTGRWTPREEPA